MVTVNEVITTPITGTIIGTVTSNGIPVSNATVTINNKTAITNESGVFIIKNIPKGDFTITVSAPGSTEGSSLCVSYKFIPDLAITSFTPAITQYENKTYTFMVTTNQPTDTNKWYLDNNLIDNQTTQFFTHTWSYSDSRVHNITYFGANANGSVSKTWNITVINVNRAPVISGLKNQSGIVGIPWTYNIEENISDPDGDRLTIETNDHNITVNDHNLAFNYSEVVTNKPVVVTVTDSELSASQTLYVTVIPNPGNLTGIVTNTGTPVSYATVTINHKTLKTNESGVYVVEDLPTGNYIITALALGYANTTKEVEVSGRETIKMDLVLKSPRLDVDLQEKPSYTIGSDLGYFLWQSEDKVWHIRWSGNGMDHNFKGTINSTGSFSRVTQYDLETGDLISSDNSSITFNASESNGEDGIDFKTTGTQVTFELKVDLVNMKLTIPNKQ